RETPIHLRDRWRAARGGERDVSATNRSGSWSETAICVVQGRCRGVVAEGCGIDEYRPNRPIAIDTESSPHHGCPLARHIPHRAKSWLHIPTKLLGLPGRVEAVAQLHHSKSRIELGKFISVLCQRCFVLVSQPEVESEPRSDTPVILDKGAERIVSEQ